MGEELLRFTGKVMKQGRITLPAWLREEFDIEEGDIIELEVKKITNVSKILKKKKRG
jgi:AbrB family looped-hinge helix DNA binding protein